jgi:hypothetical protein
MPSRASWKSRKREKLSKRRSGRRRLDDSVNGEW